MGWNCLLKKLFFSQKITPELKKLKIELTRLPDFSINAATISKEEEKIINNINKQTAIRNSNNFTRTQAYLNFYQKFPEIQWAFLGHMVSRNGGWNMTDVNYPPLTTLTGCLKWGLLG